MVLVWFCHRWFCQFLVLACAHAQHYAHCYMVHVRIPPHAVYLPAGSAVLPHVLRFTLHCGSCAASPAWFIPTFHIPTHFLGSAVCFHTPACAACRFFAVTAYAFPLLVPGSSSYGSAIRGSGSCCLVLRFCCPLRFVVGLRWLVCVLRIRALFLPHVLPDCRATAPATPAPFMRWFCAPHRFYRRFWFTQFTPYHCPLVSLRWLVRSRLPFPCCHHTRFCPSTRRVLVLVLPPHAVLGSTRFYFWFCTRFITTHMRLRLPRLFTALLFACWFALFYGWFLNGCCRHLPGYTGFRAWFWVRARLSPHRLRHCYAQNTATRAPSPARVPHGSVRAGFMLTVGSPVRATSCRCSL